MEEDKEGVSSQPQLKIDSDFLNFLQNEIPNLKISNFPINKDDLKAKNMLEGEAEEDREKQQSHGFYDILGLSKRQPRDPE